MTPLTKLAPEAGQLWINESFSIVARVLHVDLALARVRYELLDLDGSQLGEPVSAMFDQSWWQFFRPFHHRIG